MPEPLAGRVAAEIEGPAADTARPVACEHGAVGGEDGAPLDRELRDDLDRVVAAVGQIGRRPRLPIRRTDDQRDHEHERGDCKPADLMVHCRKPWLARFETSSRPASSTKFATMLEPP